LSAAAENVKLVRAAFEGWAAGERTGRYFDQDVEVIMPHPGMSVSGREQMGAAMRDFRGMWEEYEFEIEEIRALDDERVLALFTERVKGAASGISQEARPGVVCTVRADRIVRFEAHLRREDALRAAGLAPDAPQAGS
jgi:ketosteroid isomerase-like protein